MCKDDEKVIQKDKIVNKNSNIEIGNYIRANENFNYKRPEKKNRPILVSAFPVKKAPETIKEVSKVESGENL